ncbi:MAG: TraR/DksA family transcriptional regulator [Thermodesulfobacteriota bacterium]
MIDPRDEGEVAQDYQARHNQAAIEAVLAEARRQTGPGLEFCEDCGDEIPPGRREAQPGATRCVECQSLHGRLREGM